MTDSTSGDKLRKIVSLAEDTDKVSSLEVCSLVMWHICIHVYKV